MFYNIEQVKEANKIINHYFFSKSTMQFFKSKISSGIIHKNNKMYFISSEQMQYSDGFREDRKYTIRIVSENGEVNTIGEFQQFKSLHKARTYINNYL